MSGVAGNNKKSFTVGVYVPGEDDHGSSDIASSSNHSRQQHRPAAECEGGSPQLRNEHINSYDGSVVSLDDLSNEGNLDGGVIPEDQATRERQGLCIKCGQKLFRTKKKGIFKQKEVKIPLSVPGQVERGQCLQCGVNDDEELRQGKSSSTTRAHSPSSSFTEDELQIAGVPHTGASIIPTSAGNQSKATYEGQFNVYGERDGKGVMNWENRDVYTGDFFNGNRHGNGTLQFADGSEYVGEWECNRQHGIGTRRWNNGDCYTGQYKNGKRTGEGRFYFANGDMYVGNWKEGIMEGFGRYYYASGQRFEGHFAQGKRKGKGKLQRTDGSLDIGVYSNDVRVGVGVRWSADRTQAWKMCDGLVKKKVTVPEAVAIDYDIEAAASALESDEGQVV
jgi:hypothetical protein